MPVRNFEGYLRERRLVEECPLEALSDTRLGIDLSHYLGNLLGSPSTREPLVSATGGLPLSLTHLIEADLRTLDRLRIKPVFVCPGLPLASRPPLKGSIARLREGQLRRDAWDNYENGRVEDAVALLEGTTWTEQRDVARLVLRIFRHRSVEFIVAPYLASAQLIYLQKQPKGYIHSIYASSEALFYPHQLDKLILSLDLTSCTMTFVSKPAVLKDLGLSDDQFLDLMLLSGSDLGPPFPPLAHHAGGWKPVVDALRHFKTGAGVVAAHGGDPTLKELGTADAFARARCAVKFALVLTADEGRCTPLPIALPPSPPTAPALASAAAAAAASSSSPSISSANPTSSSSSTSAGGVSPSPPTPSPTTVITTAGDVPSDLHDIFSHRLPDEVYFHLCRGLVSPQLLGWLTSGLLVEPPPLDGGESVEYQSFIRNVITDGGTAPRCTALGLISSVLSPTFWPKRVVNAYFYFDPPSPHPRQPLQRNWPVPHSGPITSQLIQRCLTWHVPCAVVEDELRRQNSSTIDFKLCLEATSEEKYAARTRKPDPAAVSSSEGDEPHHQQQRALAAIPRPLEKKDEIVANVIWRFLDLRGFLTPGHLHGPLAQALSAGLKAARVNDKLQDPLYLALELTRAGVLHGEPWSQRSWSGGPSFGSDGEKASTLLIMRVLSIVPLKFKTQQWSGPLSRELLVFNSFLKALSRSLRHLLEAVSLHMLLRNDARRVRDDFLDIALALPFQTDTNTGFGILAKVYLDATITLYGDCIREGDEHSEDAREAKEQAIEICEQTFIGVKNPRAEIERGFRFWDVVLVSIRSLAASQKGKSAVDIQPQVAEQWEAAERWLRPMRP